MDNIPLLNGAPSFTILAFTVALAAYLRQVSMTAQENLEKIKSNSIASFPYEGDKAHKHTWEKLALLESTRNGISTLTPWLFGLMLIIAGRIVIDAFSRMFYTGSIIYLYLLHAIDLIITSSILLFIIGLWIMHRRARNKEHKVRELTDAWVNTRSLQFPHEP